MTGFHLGFWFQVTNVLGSGHLAFQMFSSCKGLTGVEQIRGTGIRESWLKIPDILATGPLGRLFELLTLVVSMSRMPVIPGSSELLVQENKCCECRPVRRGSPAMTFLLLHACHSP